LSDRPDWPRGCGFAVVQARNLPFLSSSPSDSLGFPGKEALMEWVTPDHEEIELNCEVSSYANAEL
jgi:hypothetical protein